MMQTGLWPGGAESAVAITVNVDAEYRLLQRDPGLVGFTKTLSTSRYGVEHGIDNLVDVFTEAQVPATWFVPGVVAGSAGEQLARVLGRGDELALRGWDLDRIDTAPPQLRRERLDRAITALETLGSKPTGFRLAAGDWPLGLVDDLHERGIRWSSSWPATDIPFALRGERGELVELGFHWAAEDRQSFDWNFSPAMPPGHSRIAGYSDVLENWRYEFSGSHSEGGCWVLVLHPEIIGTPGRLGILRELLATVRQSGAWVATAGEIAQHWASLGAAPDPEHPAEVFLRESGRPHY